MRPERELVLIKIRAPPGPTRMEVLQLVEIFRARVADVSERSITLCATGDAGKARPPRAPPAPAELARRRHARSQAECSWGLL